MTNIARVLAVVVGTIAWFVTAEPVAFLAVVAIEYVSEEAPRLLTREGRSAIIR